MNNVKIDKFRRFGFTNTAYISGDFTSFSLNDKSLIKDSNFKINNGKFNVSSLEDMFNGCTNASFTHTLRLTNSDETSSIKNANRMFYGCSFARLPSVRIKDSNLEECESMFEGCANAILDKVDIPSKARNVVNMFKGCKNATFDNITELVVSDATNYSGIFQGCTNGNFRRIHITKPADNKAYIFSNSFYGCENINSDNLYLENISALITDASYMFFNAGVNGAETFNNTITPFENLKRATNMFNSSKFAFDSSYFQFKNSLKLDITDLNKFFYNTDGVSNTAPVIVLSDASFSSIDAIDKSLETGFTGHFTHITQGSEINVRGIKDFTEVYANSTMKEVDLRGIANNTSLDTIFNNVEKYYGILDFTSMCENCEELTTIKGHIPAHGKTYKNMFKGCSKLKADLSKLFLNHSDIVGWNPKDSSKMEGINGATFKSYNASSMEAMFNGCEGIYSSSDEFDLIGLPKKIKQTHDKLGISSYDNAFKSLFTRPFIAPKNTIQNLKDVIYDLTDISKNYGIIRYNSNSDEPYDINGENPSEFGLYSKYARLMFGEGFYRFGGYFKDDTEKFFCLIEHPNKDEQSGDVTGFELQQELFSNLIIPHDFNKNFNTDKSQGYWNEFKYDKVYAAKIYDSHTGKFLYNRFVGSYTRYLYETRFDGEKTYVTCKTYDMPVTYFDTFSKLIKIKELIEE